MLGPFRDRPTVRTARADVLLDGASPWMVKNADSLCLADPESDDEPGYYGLN